MIARATMRHALITVAEGIGILLIAIAIILAAVPALLGIALCSIGKDFGK